MSARLQMGLFSSAIGLASLAGIAYILAAPPPGLRLTADGQPHFSPLVMHPETGEGIRLDVLIRHYKEG